MIRNVMIAISMIVMMLLALYSLAHAQHDHDKHHAFYQNWVNQNNTGCCNNQDCGTLSDEDERSVSKGVEVRIEGKWCPVLSHHYLKKGNAPDWSSAHICVQKQWSGQPTDPCGRLLCYQPRPGI